MKAGVATGSATGAGHCRESLAALCGSMAARLLRLLSILALMLMSVSMASAQPVAGDPADHSNPIASGASHCDEMAPAGDQAGDRLAQCAMACAMMLPQAAAVQQAIPIQRLLPGWTAAPLPAALRPETDPPPPKFA